MAYWTEEGYERTELLGLVIAYLNERRWGRVIDSGWSNWDLEVYCHPWTIVRICTAQQDYGSGKRLISVRYRLHPSGYTKIVAALAALSAAVAVGYYAWLPAVEAVLLLAACVGVWWRGTCRASQAMAVVDFLATELGLVRCEPSPPQQQAPGEPVQCPGEHRDGSLSPPPQKQTAARVPTPAEAPAT